MSVMPSGTLYINFKKRPYTKRTLNEKIVGVCLIRGLESLKSWGTATVYVCWLAVRAHASIYKSSGVLWRRWRASTCAGTVATLVCFRLDMYRHCSHLSPRLGEEKRLADRGITGRCF